VNRLYWRLARQVRRARPAAVAGIAATVVALLSIPVLVSVVLLPPHQFYAQHYGVNLQELAELARGNIPPVIADGDGYALAFDIAEPRTIEGPDAALVFTPEYVQYADAQTQLILPAADLPVWVVEEAAFEEMFDRLALYNGYYQRFLFPALAMRLLIVLAMVLVYYIGIGYAMGITRLDIHRLPFKTRLKCLIVSSYPPAMLCFPIGLLMPMMHLFLFQLLAMLLGYMVLKEL